MIGQADVWRLSREFRKVMGLFISVTVKDVKLLGTEEVTILKVRDVEGEVAALGLPKRRCCVEDRLP